MLTASTLPRMVLRAVYALTESGSAPSLRTVLAVVPAPSAKVEATIKALDSQGYLDANRMRLTMRGLAAACSPRMIEASAVPATERRKTPRDRHWAGSMAPVSRPGLRKAASVA